MVRYGLGVFELSVVLQVGGDAGGAESVIADPGLDTGDTGAALNHPVGVLLPHRLLLTGLAARRSKQRPVRIARDPGRRDVLVEVFLKVVMTGDLMLLAVLLMQADPAAASLHEIVAYLHL